jgi:hypothetical protein
VGNGSSARILPTTKSTSKLTRKERRERWFGRRKHDPSSVAEYRVTSFVVPREQGRGHSSSLNTTNICIYIIYIKPTTPMQSRKPSHSSHSAISDSRSPITPCDSFDRAEQTLDTAIRCTILRCLSAGCYLPHCSRVFPGVCRSLAAR